MVVIGLLYLISRNGADRFEAILTGIGLSLLLGYGWVLAVLPGKKTEATAKSEMSGSSDVIDARADSTARNF